MSSLKFGRSSRNRRPFPQDMRTRGNADTQIMRSIIQFLGAWEFCDSPACLRKKGCASPTVGCFDLNLGPITETLQELANWRRLEGPRTPEEAAAPVTELFDQSDELLDQFD